jgi:hypothetical protein
MQELQKTITQCIIYFGYSKVHLVCHMSDSIWWMDSGDTVTTDVSEWIHISKVKEAYWSSNIVNYIRQMPNNNGLCTTLDSMVETKSYLTLQSWYDIDSTKMFQLLSVTNTQWSTCRAHWLQLQRIQDEPYLRTASQHVYHVSETHVLRVCSSIKLFSLRDVS